MSFPTNRLSNAELLVLTRAILLSVDAEHPERVSQRRFDAARAEAGQPGCPRATNLCRRFNESWPDLTALACNEKTGFRQSVSRARAKPKHEGAGFDRATSLAALRTVASRLTTKTLLPSQYEDERREMLAGARGRCRAALEARLPTVEQFSSLGRWDDVLVEAGLEARGEQPTSARGVDELAFIELFLEAQGYLPTYPLMVRFARELEVSTPRRTKAQMLVIHDEIRERRGAQGLWTPADYPPSAHYLPPWQSPVQSGIKAPESAGTRNRKNYWTLELIEAGLRLAATLLEGDDRLNQKTVRRLSKSNPDIPSPTVIGRVAAQHDTTFSALRDAAIATARLRLGSLTVRRAS